MNCSNCFVNIPSEWSAVIAKNLCPACDQPIFNDFAVELMTELKEALEQMPTDNVQGLVSWLISNYKMTKIGDAKPVTEFLDGSKKSKQLPQNEQNLKIANNPLQEFIKRTGLDPNIANKHKALVAEIVSGNIDEEPEISVNDNDLPETEDPEYTLAAVRAMDGGSQGNSQKRGKTTPQIQDDGTDDLPPALQIDRLKRLQQQQNIANGIKPMGGGNNGFTRSG